MSQPIHIRAIFFQRLNYPKSPENFGDETLNVALSYKIISFLIALYVAAIVFYCYRE